MKKYLFLSVFVSASCLSGLTQTSSQTKTAAFLNNIGNFRQFYGHLNYPTAEANDLATDDNIYGSTNKLSSVSDSSAIPRKNSLSTLSLQGFGFTIPEDATIGNISVRIRRFATGRSATVGDHTLSLMQRFDCNAGICRYGKFLTYLDDYAGKIYPSVETELVVSQDGSGIDGGFFHNEPYQWTPAIVNHPFFGVRIDNYAPIGRGPVTIFYDLVEVTIEYSQTVTISGRSPVATEIKPLKESIVYPNPFTTKTNIQFTAAESGNAVVELYSVTGAKVRSLFSGNVVRGQVYNVAVGDAQLPKGIYVFRISNGKQKQTGRIIKSE